MKLNEISENISHTSKRLRDIERKKGVKPGTPEWFKLWFSLPYLKESAEKVYNILDNVDCGPFDGGCVLVAQALQQIHGGDIVVLVNDNGIADHAAVKVGNTLVDFDGALPVKQFIKRFEDNEHTNIKSIRPIQNGDLPEAPRNNELVPQLVNALTESLLHEGYKIQLERGKDMDVLHIVDTKTNKRTEVRGKPGYETTYDPNDSLHQLIDKIGKAANISELINGEVVTINPKHPDSNRATSATATAFNEVLDQPYPIRWSVKKDNEWYGHAKEDDFYNQMGIEIKSISEGRWSIRFKVGDKMDKTGEGDQFKIFATVKAAIQEWWAWANKNVQVDQITFSAEKIVDASRSRLYNRFAKQFANAIGYEMKVNPGRTADIFYIEKPGVKENFADGKITEVLDNPYPINWTEKGPDMYVADSQDNLEIYIADEENEGVWEILFMRNNRMRVTQDGDEFRIFATVKLAIAQWWKDAQSKKLPINKIVFSAAKDDSKGRSILYKRFASMFAQKIGYRIETKQEVVNVGIDGNEINDVFILSNPNIEENIADDSVNGKSNAGLGLTIFDIDDTLMHTTAQIKVVKDGRPVRSLTNQEFNTYELKPGEEFDFGEFRNAEKFRRESKPMPRMIAKLKAILANAGDSKIIMLTARADFDDKETFLNTFRDLGIDMSRVHVHRAGNLGGSPAQNKAVWIKKYLDTGKYTRVRLYDDAMSNIKMFNQIAKDYPDIKFYPYLVTHEGGITTIREEVNIDNKSGRGHVPNNSEVDYFGMRVKMKPSTFIKLASKLGQEPSDEMIDYIKKGGAIASPFLIISTDGTDNPASVIDHEGRNRMLAVIKAEGDVPVEVHLFFNSNQVNRARHLTPELVGSLKQKLISQDDNIVNGPLWEDSRIVTELLNTQAKDAKWTMSGEDMNKMEFTASNGVVYEIDFLAPYIGPDEIYPTDFVPDMPKDQIEQAVFVEFSQKNAAGPAKQGVAGTGAAAEVFGIVTNAILEFARKRKPSMLYFQAAEPNRQKLYAAIVNRLVKSMPGYTVKRIGGKFAVYSNNIGENFADGKNPGRKGLAKRMGVNTKASVSSLRKTAKNSSGEKQRMAHWLANMKAGKAKKK